MISQLPIILFPRQRKELAKMEADREEQIKQKTIQLKRTNEKSLLYTMEEVIYEEVEEEEEDNKKEVITDDEIEEEIDQYKNKSFDELSEASDILEEMNEEHDDEIPEAIEYEDDSDKRHVETNKTFSINMLC